MRRYCSPTKYRNLSNWMKHIFYCGKWEWETSQQRLWTLSLNSMFICSNKKPEQIKIKSWFQRHGRNKKQFFLRFRLLLNLMHQLQSIRFHMATSRLIHHRLYVQQYAYKLSKKKKRNSEMVYELYSIIFIYYLFDYVHFSYFFVGALVHSLGDCYYYFSLFFDQSTPLLRLSEARSHYFFCMNVYLCKHEFKIARYLVGCVIWHH